MNDKERIRQLEEKLAAYESSPAAEFYIALTEGVKHITSQIKSKKLNLQEDSFADSILKLAEKADKIFAGLEKGLSAFSEQKTVPSKQAKSSTVAI